jgi:diguanylate cyclase (GGDEF)-like protein
MGKPPRFSAFSRYSEVVLFLRKRPIREERLAIAGAVAKRGNPSLMPAILERRRVLFAGLDLERNALLAQFDAGLFPGWEAVPADGLERARFVMQMEPCDVLVLDADLYRASDADSLSWLGGPDRTPLLFLADVTPGLVVEALDHGADHWLPRDLALSCPPLMAATLRTAAYLGELRRKARQADETLADCRRQVSRLVSLLWEASPVEGRAGWFNQRHMLERLDEEVARAQRHGGSFTVVLGEVQGSRESKLSPTETNHLATWTAERVTQIKRRCDVAGQYGPHGFMLLLPGANAVGGVGACRRLQSVLEEPPALEETPLPPVQACFGVAAFSPTAASVKALLRQAEERLDRAMTGAGERVEV